MNKREAVAYAQIVLDHMQGSRYTGELNLDTFAIEMKQAFKLYTKDIVLNITESQSFARKKLKDAKIGSDVIE